MNSEGVLKQGREIQALDFLPCELFLRTCFRKKEEEKNKKEKLPKIPHQGLILVCCCFSSSDQGRFLVNPGLQLQKIRFPSLRD